MNTSQCSNVPTAHQHTSQDSDRLDTPINWTNKTFETLQTNGFMLHILLSVKNKKKTMYSTATNDLTYDAVTMMITE